MKRLGHVPPVRVAPARRFEAGLASLATEMVAEETPVTLAYNGVSHAVMMASPVDLEDFAVGFSLTEGLISHADAVTAVTVVRYSRGIELQIETSAKVASDARRRRLSGRSGCGICGMADVEEVLRELPHVNSDTCFTVTAISRAVRELGAQQPLNDATGAVHAAGWANAAGAVSLVREDVGRHNALDKLVGAMARAAIDARDGFVVLTSRGSFELVQKVAILGASLVATVSAPTGLAVQIAIDTGITLAGFARDGRVTVYAHPERVRA